MVHKLEKFKVIVVGDQSVGKTHIISQYVLGQVPLDPKTTLGIDFQTKAFKDERTGEEGNFLIFDTAGEEKFHAITGMHFKKAKGCFIVYDVTNRESFDNVRKWMKQARELTDQDCQIIIIGNKCDADRYRNNPEQQRVVSKDGRFKREVTFEEGLELSRREGLNFFEVSAIDNFNVSEAFAAMASLIMQVHLAKNPDRASPGRKFKRDVPIYSQP